MKLEVSTFEWTNSNWKLILSDYVIRMKLKRGTVFPVSELIICITWIQKIDLKKIKIHLIFIVFERRPAMRNKLDFTSEGTAQSDAALFSWEIVFCILYSILIYNVLFFLNILQTEMYYVTFLKLCCYQIFCRVFLFVNQRWLHFYKSV